jgi:hypothetical protein
MKNRVQIQELINRLVRVPNQSGSVRPAKRLPVSNKHEAAVAGANAAKRINEIFRQTLNASN